MIPYGCSFVAKLSWKKNNFFLQKIFFCKLYICRKKMFLYGKKSFILNFFFTKKKLFYWEKYSYINENVKIHIFISTFFFTEKAFFNRKWKNIYIYIYISFEKHFFIKKIYIHSAKEKFFNYKKYICWNVIVNSTIWSL